MSREDSPCRETSCRSADRDYAQVQASRSGFCDLLTCAGFVVERAH